MDFQKCKICGERHRIGPCPDNARIISRPSKTPPLTEGMIVKGGRNQGPSQIVDRPPPPAPMTPRRGRPRLDEEKRKKPWEALGMSERTFWRRQKEERERAKGQT